MPRSASRLRSLLSTSALAAALALVGCGASTKFAPLNPAPRPLSERPAELVQVYTTALPSQAYVELGVIQGSQSSDLSDADMPEILAAMRKRAGKVGCDGLILNGVANRTVNPTSASNFEGGTKSLEGYWGTCIVFVDAPVAAQPAAPNTAVTVVAPPPAELVPAQ